MENPLIEFKGAYYRKGRCTPQSVLVQFDGVVLHVWHMSDPFHRLLTSDVFRLPPAIGRGKRCIKLPNGGRIETDDLNALGTIQSSSHSACICVYLEKSVPGFKIIVAGSVLLLLAGTYLIARQLLSP